MDALPLFFKLAKQPVLIIGGGDVAYRKAVLLDKAMANITVIAKEIDDKFNALSGNHQLIQKAYEPDDLKGDLKNGLKLNYRLVIVATNDKALNEQIYKDAHQMGLAVNVVDTPEFCDFIFPAIVDRSPLVVAVSSNATSPVLARLVRAKIESILPAKLGDVAKKAGEFRQVVKQTLPSITQRRQFWEGVFGRVLNETSVGADELPSQLAEFIKTDNAAQIGEVYLVGVGAGSVDLLTFKALRLMQQADVVLYDALIPTDVVDLCRRDSDKIFVGKKRANHTKTQEEINELLVALAKQGKRVLRLKGGDPFVFGRGGEEMQACQEAGVPYQVVSGITSALAASSYAGIPLTHRGVATSVRFLTGCYKSGDGFDGLKSTYQTDETLVFYMGLHALESLAVNLCQDLPHDTPVAIVSHASLPTQQVLIGTLDDIVQKQAVANLPAPAIIIVGQVVKLYRP